MTGRLASIGSFLQGPGLVLSAVLLFTLQACSSGDDASSPPPSSDNNGQSPISPIAQPSERTCSCTLLSIVCTVGQGCVPFHFCSGCGGPPANRTPVASISAPSEWVLGLGPVSVDGSASVDVNGDALSYDWLLASSPPGSQATLADQDKSVTQFTPDIFGRYIISLVVNDGQDESGIVYAAIDVESAPFSEADISASREILMPQSTHGLRNAMVIDANNDGINDLILGSCDNRFSVFLREDSGWLRTTVVATEQGGLCHDVYTVGDFNADGNADVAIGREVFTGDGFGVFSLWSRIDTEDLVSGLASGDFNGDGIDDLAVSLSESRVVRIDFGGTSLPLDNTIAAQSPLGLGVVPIDLGDDALNDFAFYSAKFDADGESDLSIVSGSSTDSFDAQVTRLPGFGSIGTGDLNGDGFADIVLSIYGGTIRTEIDNRPVLLDTDVRIATLLGNGDGTFLAPRFDGAVDHATGGLAITDINRDGLQDVLVLGAAPVRPSVLLGNGLGGYTSLTVFSEFPSGITTAGDMNGDGLIDIAIATGANTGIWMLWGRDLPF